MKVAGIVLREIRKHLLLSIVLLITITAAVITSLLPPLVLERIIDSLSGGTSLSFASVFSYFLITAASGVLDAAKEVLITAFGQKITHGIRSGMMEKLRNLPASYFTDNDPGVTASRIVGDVGTVDALFTSGIISMAADLCRLVSILFIVFTRNSGLFILLVSVLPFIFLFTRRVQKRMLSAQLENRAAISEVNQQIPETISNIRTVRILHGEDFMEKRYDRSIEKSFMSQRKMNFHDALYSPVIVSISALITGIVMASSAVNDFFGMSAGTAAAMISYISSFFSPIQGIGMEIQNVQAAVAGVKRINSLLSEAEMEKRDDSHYPETDMVRLSDVTFTYTGSDHPVMNNLSLAVHEGERITLAGRTGAGKSTIVKLIAGLYTPQKGSVTVFGKDPCTISESEKRRMIGYVEQSFHIIPGSVADQVSLHDPDVSRDEVISALTSVGLLEAAESLPEGLDTPCREDLFSMGQFQLLSIARAIVKEPRLLLLDEITANLDSETEAEVISALNRASADRTVISVSHRLTDTRTVYV
ncbi:MAG: ABC transporter ATP-binding protein [Bullifex sp.]